MTRPRAAAVAFVVGFAVMALELTAVRLLAPHFGDSAYVWTNVIGVILVALAAGAWLGGRLADGAGDAGALANRLAFLLLAAGVWVAIVPLLAAPLGGALLPQDLQLDAALSAMLRGSLVATLALFATPVALVGCATPILVKLLADTDGRVGSASGLIAATSTIGSLLGTFAATHLLVPELGSRLTVWSSSGLLLVAAIVARGPRPSSVGALAVPVVASLLVPDAIRAPGPGQELLAEVESSYQFLQVVRETPAGARPTTSLKINEGLDSFHSVAVDGTGFTEGRYYDYHAIAPFLVGDGVRPAPLRVLSLGAAAGTFARLFAVAHSSCSMDAVEIDPAVVALGEKWFGGRPCPGEIYSGLDARVFVERAKGRYEVVLVDAYEHQIYIPAHVASREFFTSVKRLLSPGGVVSVNAGGRSFDDPVVAALANTIAVVFGEAWALRVPRSRNYVLLGRRDARVDPLTLRVRDTVSDELAAVLSHAGKRGAWRRYAPEPRGRILVDDRPLLDRLQESALVADLDRGSLTRLTGSADPTAAWQVAKARLDDGAFEAALQEITQAKEATPHLRYLAGHIRWYLHDLAGAHLEYTDALALGADDQLRRAAEQQIATLDELIAQQSKAADIASWNGWLVIAAGAVLLLALGVAVRAT